MKSKTREPRRAPLPATGLVTTKLQEEPKLSQPAPVTITSTMSSVYIYALMWHLKVTQISKTSCWITTLTTCIQFNIRRHSFIKFKLVNLSFWGILGKHFDVLQMFLSHMTQVSDLTRTWCFYFPGSYFPCEVASASAWLVDSSQSQFSMSAVVAGNRCFHETLLILEMKYEGIHILESVSPSPPARSPKASSLPTLQLATVSYKPACFFPQGHDSWVSAPFTGIKWERRFSLSQVKVSLYLLPQGLNFFLGRWYMA